MSVALMQMQRSLLRCTEHGTVLKPKQKIEIYLPLVY